MSEPPVPDQLAGQLPLWQDLDTFGDYEPLCQECGTACTSSKECVEISGLYDQWGPARGTGEH